MDTINQAFEELKQAQKLADDLEIPKDISSRESLILYHLFNSLNNTLIAITEMKGE